MWCKCTITSPWTKHHITLTQTKENDSNVAVASGTRVRNKVKERWKSRVDQWESRTVRIGSAGSMQVAWGWGLSLLRDHVVTQPLTAEPDRGSVMKKAAAHVRTTLPLRHEKHNPGWAKLLLSFVHGSMFNCLVTWDHSDEWWAWLDFI